MSYQSLFQPQTIAIIGASSREKTVGNDVVKNLSQHFKGKIIPINPKIDELYGLPVIHDIDEVDEVIDLVIVAIPAQFVAQAIRIAAKKGAKAAIVISAGFKEAGNLELEQELAAVCRKNKITLIGPNCLGVINASHTMNASFASQMPAAGNVAFVSQSGALCTAVLDYAADLGLGFSKFLSIGNKAIIDEVALLEYFAKDPETDVIALYAESLTDAPAFIRAAQSLLQGPTPKPIIVLKSGRTAEGAGAIASHTGSLAGGDAAYEALFDQAGIMRADSVSQLFELTKLFSLHRIQPLERIAVVTNAGGPGVLTTDALIQNGLRLADLSETTIQSLRAFLPPAANVHNPVDILGDALAERYIDSLQLLVADPQVDGIILILTPQSMTQVNETANHVVGVSKTTTKPIAVSFMGEGLVRPGINRLKEAKVAVSQFPEPLAYGFGQMNRLAKRFTTFVEHPVVFEDIDKTAVKTLFAEYRRQNRLQLPEAEALKILEAYGFPTLKRVVVTSADEAEQAAKTFAGPVVMKIVSSDILHKSDVGGVRLNIQPDGIKKEFNMLIGHIQTVCPAARIDGVLVVEMAPKGGVELILGINAAAGLGKMVMVGLGGIYVEVFRDVAFGFAPLNQADAMRMLESLKTKKLLEGVRGSEPVDTSKVIDCMLRLSQLATDFPEIVELDINPLLAQGNKTLVLDARMVLAE
jgi:acetate---CoA ligase (ADP-forming)